MRRKQARNQGATGEKTPKFFSLPLQKCVGHSFKYLGPSQKTLRPTWCPKLVTGLDGNPALQCMQYSALQCYSATAHAFRAAMKLLVYRYENRSDAQENFLSCDGLTNVTLKWTWCGSHIKFHESQAVPSPRRLSQGCNAIKRGVGTPFPRVPTPLYH